jgi:hypothetical protein
VLRRLLASTAVLGIAVAMGASGRPALAADPPNDPRYVDQWAMVDADVALAWDRAEGLGVKVAVVSTGITESSNGAPEHPDLQNVDVAGGFPAGDTDDASGIGTHLAGIVAATKGNATGIVGVAPAATIVPVKAYTSGSVNIDAFLLALRSITPVPPVVLVDVPAEMPTTGPKADELRVALSDLAGAGATVVVGALADNVLGDLPVLAVAALVRANDTGPAPTPGRALTPGTSPAPGGLSAPGGTGTAANAAIISTDIPQPLSGAVDSYRSRAGVGQAAAHVAGTAALLRSMGATQANTRDLILGTARDLGDAATFGKGLLDTGAAVAAYQPPPPPDTTTSTTVKKAVTSTSRKPAATTAPRPTGPLPRNGGGGPVAPPEPLDATTTPAPPDPPPVTGVLAGRATETSGLGNAVDAHPWMVLAVGAGALCLAGCGLSVTLRRMADAVPPSA